MIEPYCSTAAKYFLFQCRLKNITEEQLKLHQFKIGSGETCSQRMVTRIFQSIGWGVSDHWKNSHMWGCIDLCFRHYSSPAGWSKPASLMWSPGIAMGKLVSKKKGSTTANANWQRLVASYIKLRVWWTKVAVLEYWDIIMLAFSLKVWLDISTEENFCRISSACIKRIKYWLTCLKMSF